MSPERLLQYFERISEAPDAIPRLRRFILDLAVRGKLVEQNPEDEPARELPEHDSTERETVIPDNWHAIRLGRALDMQYGKGLPAKRRQDEGRVEVFGSNGVVGYHNEALTEDPAIIIGRKGSAGALNLCNGPSWTTDVAYYVVPPRFYDIRFLFFLLQTLDLDLLAKGVKPGLSRADVYELELPLPPLAEQHRIVAKVDELMALCDELEAAQAKREDRRARLVAATLHGLNNGDTEPGTDTALDFTQSARFYLNHLPRLTTRPEHVHQLRQTILNLAVRGKLVEQDPDDEPAEKFLTNDLTETDDAVPFLIPTNWKYVSVKDVADSRLGKMLDKAKNKGDYRKYLRNVNVRWYDFDLTDVLEMRFEDAELEEFALRKGDVLVCEGGEPGRAAVWDEREKDIYFQKAIHRVRFPRGVNSHYFVFALREAANSGRLAASFTGVTIKHLTGKGLAVFRFPLPPLAEQHRIVAKVDELMALCDELEAQLTSAATTRARLLEATLHEALNGTGDTAEAAMAD